MWVNGEQVDEALIKQEERAIRPKLAAAMAGEDPVALERRVREWARENVIERVVLRQAALADPEPLPNADPAQEVELRVQRLFERVTKHLAAPRNKDITDYYRKHREEFERPERVHAAHIVKNVDEKTSEETARAAIEEIAAKLKAGARFEEVADSFSDCPGRGGDLGFFPREEMVDDFDARVFAMAPGEVSEIFRTPFGFHIAKLYEKREAGIAPLEEVREVVAEALFTQKRQNAIEQYLDRLISKAEIREE